MDLLADPFEISNQISVLYMTSTPLLPADFSSTRRLRLPRRPHNDDLERDKSGNVYTHFRVGV